MFRHTRFSLHMLSVFVVLVTVANISRAETTLIGIRGGMVLTREPQSVSFGQSQSKLYEFGPTLEIALPWKKFSFEASAMYRRIGYDDFVNTTIGSIKWDSVRANSYEVPLILKYYLPQKNPSIQPFISGGPMLRIVTNAKNKYIGRSTLSDGTEVRGETDVAIGGPLGFAVGTGFRIASGKFHISPEFRFTKWIGRLFHEEGSRGYHVESATTKVGFSIGFTFAP